MEFYHHLLVLPCDLSDPYYSGLGNSDNNTDLIEIEVNGNFEFLPSSLLCVLPSLNPKIIACMKLVKEDINFYINSRGMSENPINYSVINRQVMLESDHQLECDINPGSAGAVNDFYKYKYPWFHGNIVLEVPHVLWIKHNLSHIMMDE